MAAAEVTATLASETQLSCRAVKSLLLYFQELQGRRALEETLRAARLPSLATLEDEDQWISFADGQRLIDTLSVASADPVFARKAGHRTMTREALGVAYGLLRAFGSARLCYAKMIEVSNLYNRVGTFTVDSIGARQITFRYRSTLPEPNRRFCELRLGQFEAVPTLWELGHARASETACQVEGAQACTYRFEWPARTGVWPTVVGTAVGAIAGALAVTSVSPAWIAALLPLAGGALGTVWRLRRELAARNALALGQNEDFLRSVDRLRKSYEAIQELNRALEARVEERTRELRLTSLELERALARQLEVDQLKNRFFTNLHHDLRSPLTVVTGALSALLATPGADPSQHRFVDLALRSATRLEGMINDMLELSRIDARAATLDKVRVDLRHVAQEAVALTAPHAAAKGIVVEAQVPDAPVFAEVDVPKIDRVLMNLLTNATKFSPDGRRITVSVAVDPHDGAVIVRVADQGIGIPREEQTRIFERFARGADATRHNIHGVGIGLAVVKEFVELHGGAVSVQSEPGQGSTFEVRLPSGSRVA